ncbi:hypothetical protein BH23GEM11_BH23GEM11_05250 [soil metagenome]
MKTDVIPEAVRPDEIPTLPRDRWLDTLLWLVGSSVLFALILPIGYVSGDTVPLAERLAEGSWVWNPNRLLMEPGAALWVRLLSPLRLDYPVPDQLSMLSLLSGALSIAVVRGWIIPRVAERRWVRNFATAWFALGAAWAIVALYGYPVMLQMPFLVVMVALLLASPAGEKPPLLVLAGAAGGLAALAWISNAMIVAGLGCGVGFLAWQRHGFRAAASRVALLGGSSILVLFLPLALVWNQVIVTELGFLEWMRSYGGGVDSRLADDFGIRPGLAGLGSAIVRAGYGASMATVDLSPLAAWVRGVEVDGFRIGSRIVAFAAGVVALLAVVAGVVRNPSSLSPGRKEILVMTASFVLPVLLFGILWDTTDDKFYFQLAIPMVMAMGTIDWWWDRKWRPWLVVASIPLAFNAFDVMDRYVLYDRAGKVDALDRAYGAAELVIMPGYDDVGKLSYFVLDRGERRRAITWFADRYSPDEGIPELTRMLSDARQSCRRVVVVDIMDRTAVGNPWRILAATDGYDLESVQRVIAAELPGLDVAERAGFSFATWPGEGGAPSCAPEARPSLSRPPS